MEISIILYLLVACAYLAIAIVRAYEGDGRLSWLPGLTVLLQLGIALSYSAIAIQHAEAPTPSFKWLGPWFFVVTSGVLAIGGLLCVVPAVRAMYSSKPREMSKLTVSVLVFASVVMVILGFAAFYTWLEAGQFNLVRELADGKKEPLALDPGTALYFSIVTFATVGYGDIAPVMLMARIAVCAEIVVSMGYTVVIFSVIASFFREGQRPAPGPTAAGTNG